MGAINRLSARRVATEKRPGRHADGGGLYLRVRPNGSRAWVFMTSAGGRQKELGLGSAETVTLAEARELARRHREAIAAGRELGDEPSAKVPTFGEVADTLVANMAPSWRNEKHADKWRMTLKTYAAPLRPKRVDAVTTADVLEVLSPIWQAKPETAARVRGRIERVFAAAKALGHLRGHNPAVWKDNLDALLPPRRKLSRGHHAAMPYEDVPEFMARLAAVGGISAAALQWTILTAARTGETIGATWREVDPEAALWTVPGDRMKGGREHRVPLGPSALRVLRAMATLRPEGVDDAPVFPGTRTGRGLSNMALDMVLRRLGAADATVHGFRSSFRDWVGEETHFPREVAEAALAHAIGDETEAAYRRGDALGKRRKLMLAWDAYLTGEK